MCCKMKNSKNKRLHKPPKTPFAAFHAGSRRAEIEAFGHPLPIHKVVESKRVYKRHRFKSKDYR